MMKKWKPKKKVQMISERKKGKRVAICLSCSCGLKRRTEGSVKVSFQRWIIWRSEALTLWKLYVAYATKAMDMGSNVNPMTVVVSWPWPSVPNLLLYPSMADAMVPRVTAILSQERKVLSFAKNVLGSTLPMLDDVCYPFSPFPPLLCSSKAHLHTQNQTCAFELRVYSHLSLSLSLTEDLFSVARVGTPFSFNSCLASSLAGPSFQLLIAKEENNDENEKQTKGSKNAPLSLSLSLSVSLGGFRSLFLLLLLLFFSVSFRFVEGADL